MTIINIAGVTSVIVGVENLPRFTSASGIRYDEIVGAGAGIVIQIES